MRIDQFVAGRLLLVLVATCGLGACDVVGGEAAPSAVLITVNRQDITAARVEQALGQGDRDRPSPEAAERVIEELINEELLVQDAQASGLDGDPGFAAAQAIASRKALAALATEKILARTQAVSPAQVRDYYAGHPALYSQRRIYQFVVFAVPKSAFPDVIEKKLDSAHSVASIRNLLDRQGIPYEVHAMTAPAEDLPASKLDQFTKARTGDLLLLEHGSDVYLMSVSSVTEARVSLETASQSIERKLGDEQRRAMLKRYIDERRSRAAINYHRDALASYLAPLQQIAVPAAEPADVLNARGLAAASPDRQE